MNERTVAGTYNDGIADGIADGGTLRTRLSTAMYCLFE